MCSSYKTATSTYRPGARSVPGAQYVRRGCPYGGYFSSNSSTLPWAAKTGNLTLLPDSAVHSIVYDAKAGRATGVRVINTHDKSIKEYQAKIIFVNGSTLATNQILLNSTSDRFPNGLGNDNGLLGQVRCVS